MGLPFRMAHFNAVFCECVCSLLTDAASALREFYRVLVMGGHLVIADLYWRTPNETATAQPAAAGGGCLAGAVDRDIMDERLEAAGFEISLWEDQSDALKQLAAQLVWAGVSLTDWWGVDCAPGSSNRCRRPGYCLIVARKRRQ
jgi:SAM-dependent methyltransferase